MFVCLSHVDGKQAEGKWSLVVCKGSHAAPDQILTAPLSLWEEQEEAVFHGSSREVGGKWRPVHKYTHANVVKVGEYIRHIHVVLI